MGYDFNLMELTFHVWLLVGLVVVSVLVVVLSGVVLLFRRQLQRKTQELERQNQTLKMTEERYRRLFEMESDAIVLVDNETGQILEVNSAAVALYGYTREEWLRMKHTDVSVEPAHTRLAAVEGTTSIPVRWHRKKDGTIFPVEITACHFEWQGRLVHEAAIRDISGRRLVEDQNRRLMTAIDQAPESVVMTDVEGKIIYVNPAFEQITGYSREEVIGENPRVLKSGKQDAVFYANFWRSLSGGKVWRGRLINRKKDGALYLEDAVIAPVKDETGAVVNFIAIKRDITREEQRELQFRQSQKMDSIGRLAGGVAHDFNNILMAIIGNAELALMNLPTNHPARSDVKEVLRNSQRASDLTRQLLAFARCQNSDLRVVNVNELILNLSKMLQRLIGETIRLKTTMAPDLWAVRADPGQIEQVMVNLVVNARDAMPQGGSLSVSTANRTVRREVDSGFGELAPGEYVEIIVSDTGVGMSDEIKAHIYEPFFTTKEKGKGTGLGLATCFGIIQQSGGTIRLESEEGKGTAFTICLPRCKDAPTPGEEEPRVNVAVGSGTILCLEDDEALRLVVARALATQGYTTLAAANGKEALAVVAGHGGEIDLLLADVVLPGASGISVAQELKKTRPDMKVLFMSGYSGNGLVNEAKASFGGNYIQKPFPLSILVTKVREILAVGH
jgi:PAS domain S-box-containing protein